METTRPRVSRLALKTVAASVDVSLGGPRAGRGTSTPVPTLKAEDPPHIASKRAPRRSPHERLHPVERSVRWLLAALDRLELPCVVLRGDRELPRLPATGDLDVACAPHHAAQFERMLQRAAARYSVQIVARHRAGHLRRFQLHGVDSSLQHRLVQLELRTAETCHGVPILSARQLLQGRTRKRGHARPDVVVSALIDFLGPYLSDGSVRIEDLARLATVLEQWPAQTRVLLGDIFGTRVADELTKGLRGASRAQLFRCAGRARRAALRRAFMSAPWTSLGHFAAFGLAARMRPPFPPRQRLRAALGDASSAERVDGSATAPHLERRREVA